jgi:hypothetical protein
MATQQRQASQERQGAAVLLTLVAGFVDGVGYLVLWQMFTSHMSGNTISGSVHVGQGHWGEAFHRLFPIPMFVAGVAFGRVLVVLLYRRRVRSLFAAPFGLEAGLLAVFLICGAPRYADGGITPKFAVLPPGKSHRGSKLSLEGGAAFWLHLELAARRGLSFSGLGDGQLSPATGTLLPGHHRVD